MLENNSVIKIDLENLETSASQPQFKRLLDEGWSVISCVPVEDGGPKLIFILSPPKIDKINSKKTLNKIMIISFIFHCILAVSCMILIFNGFFS